MKLLYLLLSIVIIGIIYIIFSKKYIETLTNNLETDESQFFQTEEQYAKYRESGGLFSGLQQANNFPTYDASKPLGQQLINQPLSSQQTVTTTSTSVDDAVQQCKSITSCDQLDGTQCGYCFYNNKFQYGDENGPKTDVCPGGWVKTSEQCQERRERGICEQVTSCKEMVGQASICAWCPTKNKAFVYKEVGGLIVPKYSQDTCVDDNLITSNIGSTIGGNLGMVLQSQCDTFDSNHPCIGPNENTGPHSMQCLEHLWSAAGGKPQGTAAPQNNSSHTNYWNGMSWSGAFTDMQQWVIDANSNDWNVSSTYYEGVYGTDPDPCSSQYNPRPLECAQKTFTDAGCTTSGYGYPTTTNVAKYGTNYYGTQDWMSVINGSLIGMQNFFKSLMQNTHSTDYNTQNDSMQLCLGKQAAAPKVNITVSSCPSAKTLVGLGTDGWLYSWDGTNYKWDVIFKESSFSSFTFLGSTLFVVGNNNALYFWDLNSVQFKQIPIGIAVIEDTVAIDDLLYVVDNAGILWMVIDPLSDNPSVNQLNSSQQIGSIGRVLTQLYGMDKKGNVYTYYPNTKSWNNSDLGCCVNSATDFDNTIYGLQSNSVVNWNGSSWQPLQNSCCMLKIESVNSQLLTNFLTTNNTTSDGIGTGLSTGNIGTTRNLVLVNFGKGGMADNVSKTDVFDLLKQVQTIYPGAVLANAGDMQTVVDANIGECICGWYYYSGSNVLTSGYPTSSNSASGCGSGEQSLVSCGEDGPSWKGNKAVVYLIINDVIPNISTKLSSLNLYSKVVAKFTDNGAETP